MDASQFPLLVLMRWESEMSFEEMKKRANVITLNDVMKLHYHETRIAWHKGRIEKIERSISKRIKDA